MENTNEPQRPQQITSLPVQKKWYRHKGVIAIFILTLSAITAVWVYFILTSTQNSMPCNGPVCPTNGNYSSALYNMRPVDLNSGTGAINITGGAGSTTSPYYQPPKLPLYQGPYTPISSFLPDITNPGAVTVGVATPVVFEVQPQPYIAETAYIELEQLDGSGNVIKNWGRLNDDGLSGDPIPQDGMYATTITIQEQQTGFLNFRFKGQGQNQTVYSKPFTLEVSSVNIPTGFGSGQSTKTITDPELGTVIADEVDIITQPGISAERIQQIVREVGGTITGRISALNVWTITLPHTADASNIKAAIAKFKTYPEIQDASPDPVDNSQ